MIVSLKKGYACVTCGRPAIYECDTTTKHDLIVFSTCGVHTCKEHLGSNPQENYHRCVTCSRLRGDEGYFVKDKPEKPLPLIKIEEEEPF